MWNDLIFNFISNDLKIKQKWWLGLICQVFNFRINEWYENFVAVSMQFMIINYRYGHPQNFSLLELLLYGACCAFEFCISIFKTSVLTTFCFKTLCVGPAVFSTLNIISVHCVIILSFHNYSDSQLDRHSIKIITYNLGQYKCTLVIFQICLRLTLPSQLNLRNLWMS